MEAVFPSLLRCAPLGAAVTKKDPPPKKSPCCMAGGRGLGMCLRHPLRTLACVFLAGEAVLKWLYSSPEGPKYPKMEHIWFLH